MSTELQEQELETTEIKKDFSPSLYYIREEKNIFEDIDVDIGKRKITSLLRRHLKSKNLNIFIGSGCSLPAVPLMGNTFMKLKDSGEILELGNFDGDNKNIEGYLDWLSTGIQFLEQYTTDFTEKKKELEKSFNTTKKYLLDSIVKNYDKKLKPIIDTKANYRLFYNAIFSIRDIRDYSPVNIFTTNYDLFNEVAMEELGIQYTNGFKGTVKRTFDPSVFQLRLVDDANRYKDKWSVFRRYVKLYKIHGSIDWSYDEKSGMVVQSNDDKVGAKDSLIFPTMNKHLETQQTPYSELFRALTINLQKPDSTLIILGYGFPDEHINHLISQALMNEDFTLIIFGNKDESAAKNFIEKHCNKPNFHFIGGNLNEVGDAHFFSNVIDYINGDKDEE